MMMKKFVPVTKLIGTFAFSFWALVMHTPLPLVGLVVLELIRRVLGVGADAQFARLLDVIGQERNGRGIG